MKKGMTLGGAINVQKLLSLASTRVIDRFLFNCPELSTQDIIHILEPQIPGLVAIQNLYNLVKRTVFRKFYPKQ